jgi:magnesium chelatase family protein
MRQPDIARFAAQDNAGQRFIGQAMQSLGLSMRSYHRLLKVARTIADLAGSPSITQDHLLEALSFRSLDNTSNH